jgi:hypothetical protein
MTSDPDSSKRACMKYDHERAEQSVMSNWVGTVPRFSAKQIEYTFRIKRHMVDDILNNLANYDTFWTKTVCRAGTATISRYVKFLCAMRLRETCK